MISAIDQGEMDVADAEYSARMCVSKKTWLLWTRFLMSQFSPCSRPWQSGIVLAPSFPISSFISSDALPPWEFWGFNAEAGMRSRLLAWINSPSRRFYSARISAVAHPRMTWWIKPAKGTMGLRREEKMCSKSQAVLTLCTINVGFKFPLDVRILIAVVLGALYYCFCRGPVKPYSCSWSGCDDRYISTLCWCGLGGPYK